MVRKARRPAQTPLASFAAGLSGSQLHCRELGHNWRALTAHWDGEARCFDRRLRCTHCRTVRVQMLSGRGGVLSNRYIYPEGYLAKDVEATRGSRDAYRLEALARAIGVSLDGLEDLSEAV